LPLAMVAKILALLAICCSAAGSSVGQTLTSKWFEQPGSLNTYSFGTAQTFQEAENICIQRNGRLASLHSQGDISFVNLLAAIVAGSDGSAFWLGGQRAAVDNVNVWQWVDGSDFDLFNSTTGCTTGGSCVSNSEACISLQSSKESSAGMGSWPLKSAPCGQQNKFICKRIASSVDRSRVQARQVVTPNTPSPCVGMACNDCVTLYVAEYPYVDGCVCERGAPTESSTADGCQQLCLDVNKCFMNKNHVISYGPTPATTTTPAVPVSSRVSLTLSNVDFSAVAGGVSESQFGSIVVTAVAAILNIDPSKVKHLEIGFSRRDLHELNIKFEVLTAEDFSTIPGLIAENIKSQIESTNPELTPLLDATKVSVRIQPVGAYNPPAVVAEPNPCDGLSCGACAKLYVSQEPYASDCTCVSGHAAADKDSQATKGCNGVCQKVGQCLGTKKHAWGA